MAKDMQYHYGWEDDVLRAIQPQMDDLRGLIDQALDEEAPVVSGSLRDATYAEVDEFNSDVNVFVDSDFRNYETGQPVGDYSRRVIEGDSERPANDYIERAVASALQVWGAQNG